MTMFVRGQRWTSESEPELGLGTVVQSGGGRVQVEFPAAGEMRMYAVDHAPLQRVRFRVGDTVKTQDDQEFVVSEVSEQDGLLTYIGANQRLPEAQ
jgi:ATP-dependent helicase HepA